MVTELLLNNKRKSVAFCPMSHKLSPQLYRSLVAFLTKQKEKLC